MAPLLLLVALAAAVLLTGDGGADTVGERGAARPSGTLVFVTGSNRLTAIDMATGRRTVRTVRALPGCGPQLYATGGHVVFAGVRKGWTVVYSAPISLERPPTRLGRAHAFVPSATEGRVWLAGTDCSRRKMRGVREVTVEGRTAFASRRRVPVSWLAGAVAGGLIVPRDRGLVVWDPRTGRASPPLRLDAVTATHGRLLAGCADRSRCRELAILDADTARTVLPEPIDGRRLQPDAEFSPDGSLLAAPAGAGRRWRVALVDTRDGSATIVPGVRMATHYYPQLDWTSSGWLLILAPGGRLRAYRPGAPRAVTLPFRLPRRARAFVAG
jgi:hypothetical protein